MAAVLHHHHAERRDGEQPYALVITKAVLTVVLVTGIVAGALGAATYLLARAFVALLS